MSIETVEIAALDMRSGTQVRVAIDSEIVYEYAGHLDELPKPVAFRIEGREQLVLAAGFHRIAATEVAGQHSAEVEVREGTFEDALIFACQSNLKHGVRMTAADKRKAIRTLLREVPGRSARWYAEAVGCSHNTVLKVQNGLEGDDGGPRLTPPKEDKAPEVPEDAEPVTAPVTAAPEKGDKTSDRWGTPPHILDAARAVLGAFDLDPATEERANENVQAERIYTEADNGLEQEWAGKVWLNPPYSDPGPWMRKAQAEHAAKRVSDVIGIVPASTDVGWFGDVMWESSLCFLTGRPAFFDLIANEYRGAGRGAVVVFYIGERRETFAKHFDPLGQIVLPHAGTAWSVRRKHKGLCEVCGAACSTGRHCAEHKQLVGRADREWRTQAIEAAEDMKRGSGAVLPASIAVRVGADLADVKKLLIERGLL